MQTTDIKSGYVITNDHKKIAYDHYQSGHQKVVVIVHGFFNSKQAVLFKEMAEALNDQYDVIVMDLRGHGQSEGLFLWTAKEHLDLEAVLNYAKKMYRKIGVIGYSLGAAASLITASKTESIDSLIAVSSPTEFKKIEFQFWKMGIQENIIYNLFQEGRIGKGICPGNLWLKKEKPIDVVEHIRRPVFFIHGDRDWLVLPHHSRALHERCKSKKHLKIIEGGTHAEYLFRNDKEGTIKLFKEWFAETLKGKE